MITYLYAQEINGGIGFENKLPWHLPNDLKFFKKQTIGHTILMGRKTFDSMNQRLLPERKTIVMTTDKEYGQSIEGLKVVHTVDEVLKIAENQELIIIGGAEIFKLFLPYTTQIIRTLIKSSFQSDVFMPEIDKEKWKLVKTVPGIMDDKNLVDHEFQWWKRQVED